MKTKIVLWGENEKDEKILVAIELLEKDNKINIHTFPLSVATEDFYQSLLDKWREGKEVEFPEHTTIERPLSISEGLLPEEIKVERTDVITRAQAEWHFVVLSSKLYDIYRTELDDLKEKVEKLSEYDDKMWNEMKSFWSKVSAQAAEKNLFRDHASILKERTNNLFDKLKVLKKELQSVYEAKSKEISADLSSELQEIEGKIEKGLGVRPLFEELKKLQKKFYDAALTRKDKNKLWSKIDNAFKTLKATRSHNGGGNAKNRNNSSRIKSRYDGLLEAIRKMESSIGRDRKDKEFQDRRINQSDGQLETQIRQAKIIMIDERIKSKNEKLEDMYKTKGQLEIKLKKEEERDAQRKAKEEAKSKIAAEIKSAEANRKDQAEKLEEAANKIKESKTKKPVTPPVEVKVDEAKVDEVKAEAITSTPEVVKEAAEEPVKKEATQAPSEEKEEPSIADQVEDIVEDVVEKVSDTVEDVVDTLKAIASVVEDKLDDVIDAMQEEE